MKKSGYKMVYIDFDSTLFNSNLFLEHLNDVLNSCQVNMAIYDDYKIKMKQTGYNPINILQQMENAYPFQKDVYEKIDNLLRNSNKYLYEDVLPFLLWLKEKKIKIVLLTKGNREFQLKKIEYTGILDYLDEIITTLNEKGDLNIDYQHSIFIDDNPQEIDSLLEKNCYKIIRIKRSNCKYNNISTKEKVLEVNCLADIKKLLLEIN